MNDTVKKVINLTQVLLSSNKTPTSEDIAVAVSQAMSITPDADPSVFEAVVRNIETMVSISVPEGSELVDYEDHEPWLRDEYTSITWGFWERYRTYLEQEQMWPRDVVNKVESLTDQILGYLENPKRKGPWDRRGMVVGQVQSGKTANYTGLICKAVDAGYQVIVVLTGTHNSLRSQTQLRIDEGFLGMDTQTDRVLRTASRKIGAGKIRSPHQLQAVSLTSSAENGDFARHGSNRGLVTSLDGTPIVLVVKKNGKVLENLRKWLESFADPSADGQDQKKIRNTPLLVLDDEADQASVNTKRFDSKSTSDAAPEDIATMINLRIRELLNLFDKSAYVGYTATPFANIFIPPDNFNKKIGKDLFPSSFIVNLPVPPHYIGPAQVFGLSSHGEVTKTPLPIIRMVVKDKPTTTVSNLFDEFAEIEAKFPRLGESILAFILGCAARRARGHLKAHNSMLIHTSSRVGEQSQVLELINGAVAHIKRKLRYQTLDEANNVYVALRDLWRSDFEQTATSIRSTHPEHSFDKTTWGAVKNQLREAVGKIETKEINGSSSDCLDYFERPGGLSVIAVGGNKLSRGLTLEGLTVSYYMRASKMYDSLMQMGRWFGYRNGYLDLCRLYTSSDLIKWYGHITVASEELRAEFDRMSDFKLTPLDYGLRVRSFSGALLVTASGKMRSATKIKLSYASQLVESYSFATDRKKREYNYRAWDRFLTSLGKGWSNHLPRNQDVVTKHYFWNGVPTEALIRHFENLQTHSDSVQADPTRLKHYLELKQKRNEITEWTVILINSKSGEPTDQLIGGVPSLALTLRSASESSTLDEYILQNRRLLSMAHEALDLSKEEYEEATKLAIEGYRARANRTGKVAEEPPDSPTGCYARAARSKTRGLLVVYPLNPGDTLTFQYQPEFPFIGYATSFPGTNYPQDELEYFANQIWVGSASDGTLDFDSEEDD